MSANNVAVPDKQEILRQEEELERKNKWIYPTVITILIIIFVVGFVYGINTVLNMEGQFPPVVLTDGKTPIPQTNDELVDYLKQVAEDAVAKKPKMESGWSFNIDDNSIETDASDTFKNTLLFMSDSAEDFLENCVERHNTEFADDISDILLMPDFSADDVESFTCDYIYYRCRSCGKESLEPLDNCENCGSEYPYEMHYRDNYSFTVELKLSDEIVSKLFYPLADEIEDMYADQIDGIANITNIKSNIDRIYVYFETNRETDELKRINYGKVVSAEGSFEMLNEYSSLGTANVSAILSDSKNFSFTWPAVELNKHSTVLEPKKREELTAERICSDPGSFTVTWSSSDDNIVSVDDKGYIKAGKEPGNAVITASFDFEGKTYTDQCEVFVGYSVQFMSINKHHLTLGVNESETLKVRLSTDKKGFAMKKPTVKTVKWYTTNEDVVKVDENGVVTAVASGTAIVYALSDDGYFRSSCEVTVK